MAETENQGQKVYPSALFPELVDLVLHEGKVKFFLSSGGTVLISEQHTLRRSNLVPPYRRNIPWEIARADEVMKYFRRYSDVAPTKLNEDLFDDILAYLKDTSELPTEAHYVLLTAFAFHTHLLELANYSPMICLFAVPERGKSRTGKALTYICYRGLHVESLREAYIFRIADRFQATFFFDVMDIWRKAERSDSEDILLQRFERGSKVARVLYPDKGAHLDIVYFSIFGATILATNEPPHSILETRAVTINMPQATRNFKDDVTPAQALSIKERLTAFRAQYMNAQLPEVEKPADGRLGDILRPLLQIIRFAKPAAEPLFMELITSLQESRTRQKAETLEGELLQILGSLKVVVHRCALPVKTITKEINVDRPERYRLSPQRIGRLLSALGFEKARTATGGSAILYDERRIAELQKRFGVDLDLSQIPQFMKNSDTEAKTEGPEAHDTRSGHTQTEKDQPFDFGKDTGN